LPPGSAGTDGGGDVADQLDLSVLVSQVLLSFTLDFERDSKISLPISANTLRVLDEAGVRVGDLPRLTGVSKEANAMATGWLVRRGCAVIEPDPSASRGKVVRLTQKGLAAQAKYRRVLAATEQEWQARYRKRDISRLRGCLEALAGEDSATRRSRLFEGLEPYPDGWRASVTRPETLPHYPMVLHRGGYPDGS
jgi:DNA-binding MarR family transcriptional regulator